MGNIDRIQMDDLLNEMIAPSAATRRERERRRRFWASGIILGLTIIGMSSLTTGALFTNEDSATSNGITTGSVDISSQAGTIVVGADNLAPGDQIYQPLTVSNSGSLELRYAVEYEAQDAGSVNLSRALRVDMYAVPNVAACDRDGALGAKIGQSSAPDTYGLATAQAPIIGSATTGPDTGISVNGFASSDRTLGAGSTANSEVLCAEITFELVGENHNELQQSSSAIEFTFLAEQTINNS